MNRYIIVGGVAAGATAAARLRRLDEEAEVLLIERGPKVSYANCGLPYYIGGAIAEREALFVAQKEDIEAKYNIEVREETEVTSLDPDKKEVTLLDKKTGQTSQEAYTSLLLATGSSPIVPPFPGIEGERVFTLWTVPDTDRIKSFVEKERPKSAVVVGGGFIGLEMVENLVEQGLKVHLVEMQDQVMAPLDPDMAKMVENELAGQGVDLKLGKGLVSIHDGGRRVLLNDDSEIGCDMVLLSIGVRPNNDLAKEAGLDLGPKGHVLVDEGMRTSKPGIYAAGDIIETIDILTGQSKPLPLAGPANKQGRIAADNMVLDGLGKEEASRVKEDLAAFKSSENRLAYQGSQGTSVAKIFDLTAASTGLNEKALQAQGKKFLEDYAYSLIHPMAHAGYYPGALPMALKLVFSLEDGKVLGAQAVGYDGVDKRVDVIATSIRFGASIHDLLELELAYAPPYSSAKDPVNMAAYAASNILDGTSRVITWDQALEAAKSSDDHIILDAREEEELMVSSFDGATAIPLTQLRERLAELDKDKTYYVFCAVGLRGYLAERILKQNGFKVKNILGGIRTYQTLKGTNEAPTDRDPGDLPRTPVETRGEDVGDLVLLNACGLSCPGPIVQVSKKMEGLRAGDRLKVTASDPGFSRDIAAWCDNTGNSLIDRGKEEGHFFALIEKAGADPAQGLATRPAASPETKEKTMIVFSGDLDKAIASFIIANGAVAMGNKVNMFFTFWGLNILRRPEKVKVKKDFIGGMFSKMMPRGSKKLGLSKMNFGGAGAKMIRSVMKNNDIDSLEDLIAQAQEAGVKLTACQMSMDLMGITREELVDGVEVGGVATMLNDNDQSNMNLFI